MANTDSAISPLTENELKVAKAIIRQADDQHPADRVLREELKNRKALSGKERAAIARAVFAFYRWQGWLGSSRIPDHKIKQALSLRERFAQDPRAFTPDELQARAIPSWIAAQMEVKPEWLQALQTEPGLWLRAKPGYGPTLAQKLGFCQARSEPGLEDTLLYQGSEDLFMSSEFRAGRFEIQDLTSQLVSLLCHPQAGETWWDACAGEGGKTLHLADLMQKRGLVWATDAAEWRLQKLRRRAARAQIFNYRTRGWNGEPKLPTKTLFDGVLVDAPCSGTGTWHRNPQARWTLKLSDIQELAERQKALLRNVAPAVKPGGKLVYAVCTLTHPETREVAADFERRFPQFQIMPTTNPLNAREVAAKYLYWPQETGGNGMFVAVWRRTSTPPT